MAGVTRLFVQSQPVFVHIDPPVDRNASAINDLTNVIVGTLGLTGAIVLLAVAAGLVVGGLMFWMRSRAR
jgi:hypothetical protein